MKGVIESIFAPFSHEKVGPVSAREQSAHSFQPMHMAKSGSMALLILKKYFSVWMRGSLGTIPVPEPAELCSKHLFEELKQCAWMIYIRMRIWL